MTENAADKTTDKSKVAAAQRAFIVALFDIGWRLAAAFLTPVIAGVLIDNQRNGGQTYTIAGVIIGIVLALSVIIKLAFDINKVGK